VLPHLCAGVDGGNNIRIDSMWISIFASSVCSAAIAVAFVDLLMLDLVEQNSTLFICWAFKLGSGGVPGAGMAATILLVTVETSGG